MKRLQLKTYQNTLGWFMQVFLYFGESLRLPILFAQLVSEVFRTAISSRSTVAFLLVPPAIPGASELVTTPISVATTVSVIPIVPVATAISATSFTGIPALMIPSFLAEFKLFAIVECESDLAVKGSALNEVNFFRVNL